MNRHSCLALGAHHREARDPVGAPPPVLDVHEAPVHLVRLAGARLEPPAAVALRGGRLAPGGQEVEVGGDVGLDRGEPAAVALRDQPLEYHLRVPGALAQQVVDGPGVAREHRARHPESDAAVRLDLEAVGLDGPGSLAGYARPPAELREVACLRIEVPGALGGHRPQGLVYNLLQAIVPVIHSSVLLSPARRQHQHRGHGRERWLFSLDSDWLV